MKLQYFDEGVADQDDTILKAEIAEGSVPPKCLLAGIVVRRSREQGQDPCTVCTGPRAICEGRPRDEHSRPGRIAAGDSAAARRLVREDAIRHLRKAVALEGPAKT